MFNRIISVIILLSLLLVVVFLSACAAAGATATPAPTKAAGATPVVAATPTRPAAPTATPAPAIKRGGTIRVAHARSPQDFDVVSHAMRGETAMLNLIYDTLIVIDEQVSLKPKLAESWSISPDGKTITFKLRKGVKFHDGTDFNAAAVKANFDRIINAKQIGTTAARLIRSIDTINAVDDATVRFNLKAPSSSFMYELTEDSGGIVSPTAAEKWGADYRLHPVGTGPFKFVDFKLDVNTTLEANKDYWDKGVDGKALPYLDGAIFRPIPDETVRLVNLKAGEFDVIEDVPFKDIASLKASQDPVFADVKNTGHTRMTFRSDRPPFDNTALRQAVAYAIDKEALIKAIEFGTGAMAQTFVSPAWASVHDPNVKGIPFDKVKAKEKLKEAGKPDGFTFTAYTTTEPSHQLRAEAVQRQLAEVGIKMTLVPEDTTQVIARFTRGDYEAYFLYFIGAADPYSHALNLLPPRLQRGGTNYWDNAKYNEAFEKAEQSYDPAERKKWYSVMQQVSGDEVPAIYFSHPSKNVGMSKKVKDFKVTIQRTFRIERTWLDK